MLLSECSLLVCVCVLAYIMLLSECSLPVCVCVLAYIMLLSECSLLVCVCVLAYIMLLSECTSFCSVSVVRIAGNFRMVAVYFVLKSITRKLKFPCTIMSICSTSLC